MCDGLAGVLLPASLYCSDTMAQWLSGCICLLVIIISTARAKLSGTCNIVNDRAARDGTADWSCYEHTSGFISKETQLEFHSNINSSDLKVEIRCCSGKTLTCRAQIHDISNNASVTLDVSLENSALLCNLTLKDHGAVLEKQQILLSSNLNLLMIIVLTLGVLLATLVVVVFIVCCRNLAYSRQQQQDIQSASVLRVPQQTNGIQEDYTAFGSYKLTSIKREHPSWGEVPRPTSDP